MAEPKDTTRATVKEYLVHEAGVKPDRVEALLDKGVKEIRTGESLRSFAYYVGDQLLAKYSTEDDVDPTFIAPEETDDDDSDEN